MEAVSSLLRYWHTLRYLKPVQTAGRVRYRLARPRVDARPAPNVRALRGPFTPSAPRRASLVAPETFCFLNEAHTLAEVGWDDGRVAKLWRYNQHYFEDLHGADAVDRKVWHQALLSRWIRDNPPARGTGWEPYPTSLRIVNWIKWAWQGHALPAQATQSLAVQTRWLRRKLEWHLQGNHLFVNAKALVLAGLYFEGPEAERWLDQGFRILRKQLPEQILADGGQFERSPMYHALALEDVLDLWNACVAAGPTLHPRHARWIREQHEVIERMRRWLAAMTHPDGEIALFNDAAMGIAPSPSQLEAYACRLGFGALPSQTDGLTHLKASGYVRVQQGPMVTMLDVGPIGPDYLPGHAHADTLSFELSVYGQRVLVDSGTSEYGVGPERLRQRGTAAHNTLTVEDADSSEVWSGFRVARRARPFDLRIAERDGTTQVVCSHDGYLRLGGGAIHRRAWTFVPGSLTVHDEVSGTGRAACHWHWAPDIEISETQPITAHLGDGRSLQLETQRAALTLRRSTWHPEFGRSLASWVAVTVPEGRSSVVRFIWS